MDLEIYSEILEIINQAIHEFGGVSAADQQELERDIESLRNSIDIAQQRLDSDRGILTVRGHIEKIRSAIHEQDAETARGEIVLMSIYLGHVESDFYNTANRIVQIGRTLGRNNVPEEDILTPKDPAFESSFSNLMQQPLDMSHDQQFEFIKRNVGHQKGSMLDRLYSESFFDFRQFATFCKIAKYVNTRLWADEETDAKWIALIFHVKERIWRALADSFYYKERYALQNLDELGYETINEQLLLAFDHSSLIDQFR